MVLALNSPVPNRRVTTYFSWRKLTIQLIMLILLVILGVELYIGNNMFYHAVSMKNVASIDELRQTIRRIVFSYFSTQSKFPVLTPQTLYNGAELKDVHQPLLEPQRKRILVTGGGGFIGSHLVDKYARFTLLSI